MELFQSYRGYKPKNTKKLFQGVTEVFFKLQVSSNEINSINLKMDFT